MASSINADNGVISGSSGLKSTADASGVLALQTNGTTAVTVDTSQNVGLGVTPSAWTSNYKAFQVGAAGAFWASATSGTTLLSSNAYYDGTNYNYLLAASNYATLYSQTSGQHRWLNAPSGTAGSAITFTQAMTLNNSGALGFGNSPSYGTSGQVLTSGGSGAAPTWSTLTVSGSGGTTASGNVTLTSASSGAQSITTTTWGQYVKLPDATTMTKAACVFNIRNAGNYPLKIQNSAGVTKGFLWQGETSIVGLADNSTAAGVWDISNTEMLATTGVYSYATTLSNGNQAIRKIDADRDLLIYGSTALYGLVYNRTTQTWGSPTLIRSAASPYVQSLLISTDKMLVATSVGSAFEAVVLTLSGTTISVGTAATATLSISPTTFNNKYDGNNSRSFVAVGSSYVISYADSTEVQVRAMTVSGTTVTIGSVPTLAGTAIPAQLYVISASVVLALTGSSGAGALYAKPFTVSGTTMTAGTQATSTGSNGTILFSSVMGSRWALLDTSGGANIARGVIVSVSGTTATMSAANLGTTAVSSSTACMVGSKMLVAWNDSAGTTTWHVNTMSDNSGTPSVGTVVDKTDANNTQGFALLPTSSTTAVLSFYVSSSRQYLFKADTSGASATLSLQQCITLPSTAINYSLASAPISRSGGYTVLLTNSGTDALPNVSSDVLGARYAAIMTWGSSNFKPVNFPITGGVNTAVSEDATYLAAINVVSGSDLMWSFVEMAQ